jgi:hypothetical protein
VIVDSFFPKPDKSLLRRSANDFAQALSLSSIMFAIESSGCRHVKMFRSYDCTKPPSISIKPLPYGLNSLWLRPALALGLEGRIHHSLSVEKTPLRCDWGWIKVEP